MVLLPLLKDCRSLTVKRNVVPFESHAIALGRADVEAKLALSVGYQYRTSKPTKYNILKLRTFRINVT